MNQQTDVQALLESSKAAICEVEESMRAASMSFRREHGCDPAELKELLGGVLTDECRAQALEQFEKDLEDVEVEVAKELARRAFYSPKVGEPVRAVLPMV